MMLFLLTSCTMLAFAANSILTRLAVEGGVIDPNSFAILRVLSGAVVLLVLVRHRGEKVHWRGKARVVGATSLAVYMIGFSLAYISLDAGVGALILFGVVQISMFAHGALTGAQPTSRQMLGAAIAFAGLLVALWPGGQPHSDLAGAFAMILAGLGWAAYTISGRQSERPLATTAANFCVCLPLLAVVLLPFMSHVTVPGSLLAVICGGLTSGLGYALWYRVLPQLQQGVAAVVQLSVPVIAILAGNLLLAERITLATVLAAALVLFGIGLAVTSRSSRARHN